MKYKLDENGNIVVKDGKPVVIDDDGKEFVVDAIGASEKVQAANAEAKKFRQQAREAQATAEKFKPLVDNEVDPEKALDAIKTIGTLDEKTKADMDKLKTSINQTWEGKMTEKEQEIENLKKDLFQANVLSKFATSETAKKLVIPPDIAAEYFGKHFNPDGTAKIGEDTIYSKKNPGSVADFDEALEIIIDQRPDKQYLLKGTGTNGSGGHGQSGGGDGGDRPHGRDAIAAGLKERGIA